MQFELAGKCALITGSSSGIGFDIAKTLKAEGCRVALNGRNALKLERSARLLSGSKGIRGDVTNISEANFVVAEVLRLFGRLDILVCNVGSGRSASPGEETAHEWKRVFALNLWSAINVIDSAREALAVTKGAVVCISSICGLETVLEAPVTYSAAKAALHAYIRGISRPFGKQGLRINGVALGNILFDGSVWDQKLAENETATKSLLEKEVALGRLGSPSDVSALVAYLASPVSSYVTGSIWTIDGGQSRG